jgi:DNA polymerase elongation subunit (family B)
MVKKCYKEIIDTIVNDKTATGEIVKNEYDSLKTSTELYKQYIDNIYNYNINIKDLVVSAMLAASYKTRPVHVQLAERLKLRKQEVQVGDRIPYIFIESNDCKQPKSELGEDPKYAIENNLKYNRTCYIEQLAKPILGFYKIALKDRENLLDEIINHTNNTLIKCGGKALKPSDFKIDE